ncbi:MAG: hypothetical protein KatS3mg081_1220 [Gemmatimonadales bacterium]|nr:hypothetical protein HRbin33_00468 [bacterium HR33]GIW51865.1 MAG: hypothetical protein KatS3mg081_1220 [Gemmatimonadales bacterium]
MKARKRNVTITLDEETARWARIEAARRDLSVSELLASLIRQQMAADRSYEIAMRDFLSRSSRPLKQGGKYPARDELHERQGLC